MKKIIEFLGLLILGSISLGSCSLFPSIDPHGNEPNPEVETITDFEFVLDEKLIWNEEGDSPFYQLNLVEEETYQIRTNVDDKLGESYYFKYELGSNSNGLTINDNGTVTTKVVEKNQVGNITAKLYQTGKTKVIKSHYIIYIVKKGETAKATINDDSLEYDSSTHTYTVNLNAGDYYNIALNTTSNTSITKEYALNNEADKAFMDVTSSGVVTTVSNITEDKQGKVNITIKGAESGKTLYELYLIVNIKAPEQPEDTFKVINASTGSNIEEGATINLRVGDSLTLFVEYNDSYVYNVLTSDNECVEIDSENNEIKAISIGTAIVTAAYANKSLSMTINVSANKLVGIFARDKGDGFVILNGVLHVLTDIFAQYESGTIKNVTKSENLSTEVADYNDTYKTITLTYVEDEVTVSVSYQSKFFVTNEYQESIISTSFLDYGLNNRYYGQLHYMSNTGSIKFLVIPVWFTNSDSYFTEAQKPQIIEDITAKMLEEKTDDNYWSVKSFYEEESKGKLEIDATISEFYSTNTSSTSYTMNDASLSRKLGDDAIQWYFLNNPTDSIANYDADGNGKVDGVILFYGANYFGSTSERTDAYESSTSQSDYLDNYVFAPIGGIYGFGKSTNTARQLAAEDLSKLIPASFLRGSNTVLHEVGHTFGAKDLYEYDKNTETKTYPGGRFSMQDNNSGSHDPFQTNLIGWTKPQVYAAKDYQVGDQIKISVEDFISSGNNIILSRDWNTYNSLFDEYLILELYTPTGLNAFDAKRLNLTSAGFRLWHVDARLKDLSEGTDDEPYYTSNINGGGVYEYAGSNLEKDSKYDFAYLVRNNQYDNADAAAITNNDLFKKGSSFSMGEFCKQFPNGEKLNNEDKLGWTFSVDDIILKEDGTYTGVVTLTRINNEQTDFKAKATMKTVEVQPDGDNIEYGSELFDDPNVGITYSLNEATILSPSIYGQRDIITDSGITLFGSTTGWGASIKIYAKDKEDYTCVLTKVKVVYGIMTNGVLYGYDGEKEVTPTSFDGPESTEAAGVNDNGKEYSINSKFLQLTNSYKFTSLNHLSDILIRSIQVEYSIIPN